jgi:hypothetical protein
LVASATATVQAFLDAPAEAGFTRLGDEVRAAVDDAGDDYRRGYGP